MKPGAVFIYAYNFGMELKRLYKAPDTYKYHEKLTEEGVTVFAGTETMPLMGIDRSRNINIPFLPEKFKEAIDEVRLERAKARAAAKADKFRDTWNRTWRLARH